MPTAESKDPAEIAAREVVRLYYRGRLSDRIGWPLRTAIECLARALPPHPDISDALEILEARDEILRPLGRAVAAHLEQTDAHR